MTMTTRVSQLWDFIEAWGFRGDIKDNINNNNDDDDEDNNNNNQNNNKNNNISALGLDRDKGISTLGLDRDYRKAQQLYLLFKI